MKQIRMKILMQFLGEYKWKYWCRPMYLSGEYWCKYWYKYWVWLRDTGDKNIGLMCWYRYWYEYWCSCWANIDTNIDADLCISRVDIDDNIDADIRCESKQICVVELTYNSHKNHDEHQNNFSTISIDVHSILTIFFGICCYFSYALWWLNYIQKYLEADPIYFQNGRISYLRFFETHLLKHI